MLVVSNTSPLRYLIVVGHAELLAGLFGQILIPMGVARELGDKSAPLAVREWIAQPPAWLRIHTLQSSPDLELMTSLDLGEREAIQLTTEQKADVLIMDEWKGRAIAQRRGLPLVGALGILGDSYQRALIDDPLKILADVRRQGFRISDRLVSEFQVLLRTKYAR
jgi:predicted nucleic acid-binding protein